MQRPQTSKWKTRGTTNRPTKTMLARPIKSTDVGAKGGRSSTRQRLPSIKPKWLRMVTITFLRWHHHCTEDHRTENNHFGAVVLGAVVVPFCELSKPRWNTTTTTVQRNTRERKLVVLLLVE